MSLPRKLKNFVLFNDGNAYIGEVPEVTLPKLTRKMEDYRAGGMNGSVKLDMGMEGLAMEWTAAGFNMSALFTEDLATRTLIAALVLGALLIVGLLAYLSVRAFNLAREMELRAKALEAGLPGDTLL